VLKQCCNMALSEVLITLLPTYVLKVGIFGEHGTPSVYLFILCVSFRHLES
jgi:hypothetical protein